MADIQGIRGEDNDLPRRLPGDGMNVYLRLETTDELSLIIDGYAHPDLMEPWFSHELPEYPDDCNHIAPWITGLPAKLQVMLPSRHPPLAGSVSVQLSISIPLNNPTEEHLAVPTRELDIELYL